MMTPYDEAVFDGIKRRFPGRTTLTTTDVSNRVGIPRRYRDFLREFAYKPNARTFDFSDEGLTLRASGGKRVKARSVKVDRKRVSRRKEARRERVVPADYMPAEVNSQFVIAFEKELTIDEYVKAPWNFYKVADSVLRPGADPEGTLTDHVFVPEMKDAFYKRCDRAYLLCFNGHIVKIGGTYVGMKSRCGSYQAGTRRNRKSEGTCSTTNYHVSEAIYAALMAGVVVEWYICDVPERTVEIQVYGKPFTYRVEGIYKKFEEDFYHDYSHKTGHAPLLSDKVGKGTE